MDGSKSLLGASVEELSLYDIFFEILHVRVLFLAVDPPLHPPSAFCGFNFSTGTPDELYEWSSHLPLAQIPAHILIPVLDRLFFIGTEVPHLTSSGIHSLHILRSSCREICDIVYLWLERDEVQILLRKIRDDILIRGPIQLSRKNADSISIPRENTLPYNAAAKCVDCFKFLVEHRLVGIEYYDETGRNYLHAAIDNDNNDCLQYLLNIMTPADVDRTTDMTLSRLCGHPLVQLAEKRNQSGFEMILHQLLGHYNPLDLFDEDEFKLKLCAFISPELAEQLFIMDLNIGNAKDELGRTSWHAAAQGNPHGEDFMIWLLSRAGTEPTVKDHKGNNALMHAARENRITSIQWLCSYVDPMEPCIDVTAQGSQGEPAYALRLASASREDNSPDIFCGIMTRMPRDYFAKMDNSIGIIKFICDTLAATRHKLATRHLNPIAADRKEWENAWRVSAAKCQRLRSHLEKRVFQYGPSEWHDTHAMKAICGYARDLDLPMLVHSIVPLPPAGKVWYRIFRKRERRGERRWPWTRAT
ncbi:uncharacterized protein N7477_002024 [Penicillium maclennaniae]|uniref:uncharacterized protein n=1 Tax=Penicillium maclennaniae TaxID=1343394 RepID=UPI002541765B|nr:uncharacterized protein N7477_002024 [Penicillium maclennaniae]KAJ5682084.1 hypothetical protein N7477_002024 [Penicillium maclennaniae]